MGKLINVGAAFEKEMLGAVDELRARVINGEITALAIVVEVSRPEPPRLVVRGRFDRDPMRASSALLFANNRLMERATAKLDQSDY